MNHSNRENEKFGSFEVHDLLLGSYNKLYSIDQGLQRKWILLARIASRVNSAQFSAIPYPIPYLIPYPITYPIAYPIPYPIPYPIIIQLLSNYLSNFLSIYYPITYPIIQLIQLPLPPQHFKKLNFPVEDL